MSVKRAKKKTAKAKSKSKKAAVRRPASTKAAAAPRAQIARGKTTLLVPTGRKVGDIAHFYPKISVAVVNVTGTIREGDEIVIRGGATNFKQRVTSMQVEHQQIQEARPGQSIGLRVSEAVREGDEVYLAA